MKRLSSPYVLLAIFFTFIHFPLLLSHGVYWDGWIFYELLRHHDFATIMTERMAAGHIESIWIFWVLGLFPNFLFLSKLIMFGSLLFCAQVFLWFLNRHKILPEHWRFLAALFFSLYANFLVTVESLAILYYAVCFASFCMAALVWTKVLIPHSANSPAGKSARFAAGIFAALLFIFSFYLNGFLVFFGVFVLSDWLLSRKVVIENKLPWDIRSYIQGRWLLLMLPLLFWLLRTRPSGANLGYNAIHLRPLFLIKALGSSFLYSSMASFYFPIKKILAEPKFVLLGVLFVGTLFGMLAIVTSAPKSREKTVDLSEKIIGATWKPLAFAVLAWIAAVFPFIAVRKIPNLDDWMSRWGLLISLGQSLGLVGGFIVLSKWISQKWALRAAILILALQAVGILENYRRWDVDWFKQKAAIQFLKDRSHVASQTIEPGSIVRFVDSTQTNNLKRKLRPYEYNAWLLEAFGNETRFGLNQNANFEVEYTDNIIKLLPVAPYLKRLYLCSDFSPNLKQATIEMHGGPTSLLSWKRYFEVKRAELSGNEQRLNALLSRSFQFTIASDFIIKNTD